MHSQNMYKLYISPSNTYLIIFIYMKVATKGVMKFCLRGLLGKEQCQTLFKFLDALAGLCLEEQEPSKIQELEDQLHLVCALMERDFPVSLQVQADKLTKPLFVRSICVSILCIIHSLSFLISYYHN